MSTISDLQTEYTQLSEQCKGNEAGEIDAKCLLVFNYDYPNQPALISIDTEEFTALCPWTGLPDFGILKIIYTPTLKCIELKSLKHYLLSYRDVAIVQEHATNQILNDLVSVCQPEQMNVTLDYRIRGGMHTQVAVEYTAKA
jgi:7-cyano-7-deazaguanine reductase